MAEWQFWMLMFGVWFNSLFMTSSFSVVYPRIKLSIWWHILPGIFILYTTVMFIHSIFG